MRRILLCWSYYRVGWIEPFIALKDKFEFIFIGYIYKEDETEVNFMFQTRYFHEFKNAQDLLDSINPDKIIFMDNYTSYTASINIIARERSISTYFAHHGLYHDLNFYKNLEIISQNTTVDTKLSPRYKAHHSFSFLFKSLLLTKPILLFKLLKFIREKRSSLQNAIENNFDESLQTDFYIAFTNYNNRVFYERDKITKDKEIVVGNYYLDDFFKKQENNYTSEEYYLLIDQPLASNRYYNLGVTEEQVLEFYNKLNTYSKSKNAKLYIKLHPETYQDKFIDKLSDENIVILRQVDTVGLIQNAQGCFGTISTLLLPALVLKPCCIFRFFDSSTFHIFEQSGLAQVLDIFDFSAEEIQMEKWQKTPKQLEDFVDKFLYKTDGKSVDRLAEVLNR